MNNSNSTTIDWNLEEISSLITSPTLEYMMEINNFSLTKEVGFHEEIWDFSYIYHPEINFTQRFDFTKIESTTYKLLLKRFILQEVVIRRNRLVTVWYRFYYIRKFLISLESKNLKDIRYINVLDVEVYLKGHNYTNHSSKSKLKSALKMFFSLCSYLKLNNNTQKINAYLDNYFSWNQEKKYIKKGTTPTIPNSIQSKLVECALKDLEDTNRTIYNRIAAGVIILFFYTGMRNRELRSLEANQLEEISIFDSTKSAFILKFKTFKTIEYGDSQWTKAKAFPELVKAYKKIEELTKERRKKFNSNFLFLTMRGNIIGKPQLYFMIDNFLYRNQKDIGFLELTNEEKYLVKSKKIY